MSTDTLARRAAAPKGFEWRPGMRDHECGALCVRTLDGEPWMWVVDGDTLSRDQGEPSYPDMDDHGTQGHYIALVREAWGDGARVQVSLHVDAVVVTIYACSSMAAAGLTAETNVFEVDANRLCLALVCALESAP